MGGRLMHEPGGPVSPQHKRSRCAAPGLFVYAGWRPLAVAVWALSSGKKRQMCFSVAFSMQVCYN
jgi:hypothetical protein